jgi:hypothetical protein
VWERSQAALQALLDTRRHLSAEPRRAVLQGWEAATYPACDRTQTLQNMIKLPEVQRDNVSEGELRAFLNRCVHHQLMVHNGRSWLGGT